VKGILRPINANRLKMDE